MMGAISSKIALNVLGKDIYVSSDVKSLVMLIYSIKRDIGGFSIAIEAEPLSFVGGSARRTCLGGRLYRNLSALFFQKIDECILFNYGIVLLSSR
ncbi:hypothetical protein AYI69_g6508 [Smittium culicis]|uniref:Uncharacterized protein n=1 Tax=Smittium culicis TaxID=133412 RepID=A0A1R1XYG1_9FUNG|nr:hypothetical protein AYI69_g6508 [Smittium culicis]